MKKFGIKSNGTQKRKQNCRENICLHTNVGYISRQNEVGNAFNKFYTTLVKNRVDNAEPCDKSVT